MIPFYLKFAVGASVVAAVIGATYAKGYSDAGAKCKAAEMAVKLATMDAALAKAHKDVAESLRLQQADKEAREHALQESKKARVARDSARLERERLRDQLDTYIAAADEGGAPGAACGIDGAATNLGQLFGECAGRYEALAGEADDIAVRLSGLQRWTRGACAEAIVEGERGDK